MKHLPLVVRCYTSLYPKLRDLVLKFDSDEISRACVCAHVLKRHSVVTEQMDRFNKVRSDDAPSKKM